MDRWRLPVALRAAIALMLTAAVMFGPATPAPADVTTNNQDNLRTGWYSNQPGLSPSAVTSTTFHPLFAAAVDGQVYAQPLVSIGTLIVV